MAETTLKAELIRTIREALRGGIPPEVIGRAMIAIGTCLVHDDAGPTGAILALDETRAAIYPDALN